MASRIVREFEALLEEMELELMLGEKNKWIEMTPSEVAKSPKLAQSLFDLIQNAYAGIGGHFKIRSPQDLIGGNLSVITATDIDDDPEPDAVIPAKQKTGGTKLTGLGHDGAAASKTVVLQKYADQLKINVFSELSGALAAIMLRRYNIPSIDDEAKVRKIVGKDLEWVGEHPSGKFPGNNGWFKRSIGGNTEMKIIVGSPTGV